MNAYRFLKVRNLVCMNIQDANLSSVLAENISYALDYSTSSCEMLIRLNFYADQILTSPNLYSSEIIQLASGLHSDMIKFIT